VLVVGPSATFLRYIDQVLPSLGEAEVVLSTVEELLPGVVVTGAESPDASRIKGRLQMADVIARAVRAVRRNPARQDVTPEGLLTQLWSCPERLAVAAPELSATERAALYRRPGNPWTRADVAPLDEAADLLGDNRAAIQQRRQAEVERAAADAEHLAYTREVVHSGLVAGALTIDPLDIEPFIALMPERTQYRDAPGTIAERAAADRTWQFGHVIVDEAQELSAMEWRMVMRRSRRRSMTLVGDLAQGRHRCRDAVLGGTARSVHARPLAYRRADRELPDSGRDHGRRGRRADRHRPGGRATGIGTLHRRGPVEPVPAR
jgi:hypothetical protein